MILADGKIQPIVCHRRKKNQMSDGRSSTMAGEFCGNISDADSGFDDCGTVTIPVIRTVMTKDDFGRTVATTYTDFVSVKKKHDRGSLQQISDDGRSTGDFTKSSWSSALSLNDTRNLNVSKESFDVKKSPVDTNTEFIFDKSKVLGSDFSLNSFNIDDIKFVKSSKDYSKQTEEQKRMRFLSAPKEHRLKRPTIRDINTVQNVYSIAETTRRKYRSKSADAKSNRKKYLGSQSIFSPVYTNVLSPETMRNRKIWADVVRKDCILEEEYYKVPYEACNREIILGRLSNPEKLLYNFRRLKKLRENQSYQRDKKLYTLDNLYKISQTPEEIMNNKNIINNLVLSKIKNSRDTELMVGRKFTQSKNQNLSDTKRYTLQKSKHAQNIKILPAELKVQQLPNQYESIKSKNMDLTNSDILSKNSLEKYSLSETKKLSKFNLNNVDPEADNKITHGIVQLIEELNQINSIEYESPSPCSSPESVITIEMPHSPSLQNEIATPEHGSPCFASPDPGSPYSFDLAPSPSHNFKSQNITDIKEKSKEVQFGSLENIKSTKPDSPTQEDPNKKSTKACRKLEFESASTFNDLHGKSFSIFDTVKMSRNVGEITTEKGTEKNNDISKSAEKVRKLDKKSGFEDSPKSSESQKVHFVFPHQESVEVNQAKVNTDNTKTTARENVDPKTNKNTARADSNKSKNPDLEINIEVSESIDISFDHEKGRKEEQRQHKINDNLENLGKVQEAEFHNYQKSKNNNLNKNLYNEKKKISQSNDDIMEEIEVEIEYNNSKNKNRDKKVSFSNENFEVVFESENDEKSVNVMEDKAKNYTYLIKTYMTNLPDLSPAPRVTNVKKVFDGKTNFDENRIRETDENSKKENKKEAVNVKHKVSNFEENKLHLTPSHHLISKGNKISNMTKVVANIEEAPLQQKPPIPPRSIINPYSTYSKPPKVIIKPKSLPRRIYKVSPNVKTFPTTSENTSYKDSKENKTFPKQTNLFNTNETKVFHSFETPRNSPNFNKVKIYLSSPPGNTTHRIELITTTISGTPNINTRQIKVPLSEVIQDWVSSDGNKSGNPKKSFVKLSTNFNPNVVNVSKPLMHTHL